MLRGIACVILPIRQLFKTTNIEGKGKKTTYLYITERKWREDGVNSVMRSYCHPFPQNNKGQGKRKFDCGRRSTYNVDCDMSASGNVKGRERGNSGKAICKWILNFRHRASSI
jgi:hypothetical protein